MDFFSDWLIEVCEVYRLHRETFYLAVDFIDRFLGVAPAVPKNRLQLIGVTCLFIGAKIEEIYPPKLPEFAYVTGTFGDLLFSYSWIKCKFFFSFFRWRLYRAENSADGVDDLKRSQLGPFPYDTQCLDEVVHTDLQRIQETS